MDTLINEMDKYIKSLENEKSKLLKRINDIEKQISTAKNFRQTVKKRSFVKIIESIVTENQELVDLLKEKRKEHKITQIKAIEKIAEIIADENKLFKLNDVKNIMVEAGFFKTPKNATSILITIIKRNEKLFEKVEPGVYKIVDTEKKESQGISQSQQNSVFENSFFKDKQGVEN